MPATKHRQSFKLVSLDSDTATKGLAESHNTEIIERMVDEGYSSAEINQQLVAYAVTEAAKGLSEKFGVAMKLAELACHKVVKRNDSLVRLLPKNIAKKIDALQLRRAKVTSFHKRHTANDVRTHLRHLFKCDPHDPGVEQWVERVNGVFGYLHDQIKAGKVDEYQVRLVDVDQNSGGKIEVSLRCNNEAEEAEIMKIIEGAVTVRVH